MNLRARIIADLRLPILADPSPILKKQVKADLSGRYPPSRFVTQARDLFKNCQLNLASVTNKVIIGDEKYIFSESQKR